MKTIMTAVALLVICSSCYTANKARKQVVYANARHPAVVAALCGQLYPPQDSSHTEMQYIHGETKYLPGDTMYVNCDSGINKGNNKVVVPCPPTGYRVDTIRDISRVYLVNRAKEQVQQNTIEELNKKCSGLQKERRLCVYWAVVATLAAIAMLALLVKNK